MKMFIKNRLANNEYTCELTEKLDELAGFTSQNRKISFYKHYVLVDKGFISDKQLPIRVPGGTVGCIKITPDFEITSILIDTNYVVKTYPADIDEKIEEYIGKKLDMPEYFN